MPAKNEYQSLVSPIVRSGGLSRTIHSRQMNDPNIVEDNAANTTGAVLWLQNAKTDPAREAAMAATAKYMNISQPIISSAL